MDARTQLAVARAITKPRKRGRRRRRRRLAHPVVPRCGSGDVVHCVNKTTPDGVIYPDCSCLPGEYFFAGGRKRGRRRRRRKAVHPLLTARPSLHPRCTSNFCKECKEIGGEPTLGGDCRFSDGTLIPKPAPGGGAPGWRPLAVPPLTPRCTSNFCKECKEIGGEPTLGGDCRFSDGTIIAKPKSGSAPPWRPTRGVSFAGQIAVSNPVGFQRAKVRRRGPHSKVIRQRGAGVIRLGPGSARGCSPTSCPYGMKCVMGRCQYEHDPPAFMGRRRTRRRLPTRAPKTRSIPGTGSFSDCYVYCLQEGGAPGLCITACT